MDKHFMEEQIGRKLTATEAKTVEWIAGWDRQTQINLMALISAASESGFRKGVQAVCDKALQVKS